MTSVNIKHIQPYIFQGNVFPSYRMHIDTNTCLKINTPVRYALLCRPTFSPELYARSRGSIDIQEYIQLYYGYYMLYDYDVDDKINCDWCG